jgi:hypothetical protein
MDTVFSNPINWAASAVGSRFRLCLMTFLLGFMQLFTLHVAVTDGFRAALAMALFLIWSQFLLLYAMRKMYLRIVPRPRQP